MQLEEGAVSVWRGWVGRRGGKKCAGVFEGGGGYAQEAGPMVDTPKYMNEHQKTHKANHSMNVRNYYYEHHLPANPPLPRIPIPEGGGNGAGIFW